MLTLITKEDAEGLRESYRLECKLAQGRDGLGSLPENVWESYSAFANSEGGDIVLGLEELADKSFRLAGIEKVKEVLEALWQGLNDPRTVSANLLSPRDVRAVHIESKTILIIHVPAAEGLEKPVYINGDRPSGTYKRHGSSDVQVGEETILQLMKG